jgi:hypothetical protein
VVPGGGKVVRSAPSGVLAFLSPIAAGPPPVPPPPSRTVVSELAFGCCISFRGSLANWGDACAGGGGGAVLAGCGPALPRPVAYLAGNICNLCREGRWFRAGGRWFGPLPPGFRRPFLPSPPALPPVELPCVGLAFVWCISFRRGGRGFRAVGRWCGPLPPGFWRSFLPSPPALPPVELTIA